MDLGITKTTPSTKATFIGSSGAERTRYFWPPASERTTMKVTWSTNMEPASTAIFAVMAPVLSFTIPTMLLEATKACLTMSGDPL
jgi:hypothetical protein